MEDKLRAKAVVVPLVGQENDRYALMIWSGLPADMNQERQHGPPRAALDTIRP